MKRGLCAVAALFGVVAMVFAMSPIVAQADPVITRVETDGRVVELTVRSQAMGRDVPVVVIASADRAAPHGTYYLLDGNSGQTESNNWLAPDKGDAATLFAQENINVVLPVGGTGTLYTDWVEEHPETGVLRWETFLTKELPQVVEPYLGANGARAVGGISSGAQGALMLGARNPGFYRAVVGYSGCYFTDGPAGAVLTDLTVINGGANATMMWGPVGGPQWRAHDLFANGAGLRGTSVYLASGSGVPAAGAANSLTASALEVGSSFCTDRLADSLRTRGVSVTRSAAPFGTHLWPFWRSELTRSLPLLRAELGG